MKYQVIISFDASITGALEQTQRLRKRLARWFPFKVRTELRELKQGGYDTILDIDDRETSPGGAK